MLGETVQLLAAGNIPNADGIVVVAGCYKTLAIGGKSKVEEPCNALS
jgi:hypothetical protein